MNMPTPPFFAVQKQVEKGETTLVAVQYELDQNDIDPNNNLTLYVDTLTIPAKTFRLPAKNITIYSRHIIAAPGAELYTTAAGITNPVLPPNPPKAPNGAARGEPGKNGADGGVTPETVGKHGGAAGNITINAGSITGKIFLSAMGGQGQQGQNGQDGGDGMQGRDGIDANVGTAPMRPATMGERGANGGNGGRAGRSGNGGAGGAVSVMLATPLPHNAVSHRNDGGAAGNPAKPGQGGNGGKPGLGGREGKRRRDLPVYGGLGARLPNWMVAPGSTGATGASAEPAAEGAAGITQILGEVDPAGMLGLNTSMLGMLTLTMRFAEIEYISGNLAKAIDYYKWVAGLTSGVTTASGLQAEFAALHRQSGALLNQLSQGLDFFANPMSYVPIVALDHYQAALDGMLQTGANIEAIFNAYTAFEHPQKIGFARMGEAIAQAKEAIKSYQRIQANIKAQIDGLPAVINRLGEALIVQHEVLMKANDKFKDAVARLGVCTFPVVLSVMRTVVSTGKSVFAAWKNPSIGSLATSVTDLVRLGISIENGSIVKNPLAIPGNPDDVAKAWRSINPSGVGDVADDKKLIVLRDEFDKTMEPYLSLPEAQEYQAQLHDFIGIAQARNAKLLEYTNAIIQYAQIIGVIAQKEEEVKRIEGQRAFENMPGLISYRNFLFNLYNDFRSFVLKYLYQENRAFIYWSLTEREFAPKDTSFAGLSVRHSELTGEIIDHIDRFTNPNQRITDLKIELNATQRESQLATFKSTRRLTFNINTAEDYFLGWYNVRLTNFRIYLRGKELEESGRYYIQLIHHGSVFVMDADDQLREFTHNQVLSVYQYRMDNGKPVTMAGGSLGGDDTGDNSRRIALSPYATFTIAVPERLNPDVNLDGLESIEIHFAGFARPVKAMSRRALPAS